MPMNVRYPVPARRTAKEGPSIYLVAHDLSEEGERALGLGLSLASSHGAELHVVHVRTPPSPPYSMDSATIAPAYALGDVNVTRDIEDAIERQIERAQVPERASEIPVHILYGDPAREVCKTAEESGASMVIVGTHSRSGVTRLLLGSVAEKVAREAPCPVLIARNSDRAREEEQSGTTAGDTKASQASR